MVASGGGGAWPPPPVRAEGLTGSERGQPPRANPPEPLPAAAGTGPQVCRDAGSAETRSTGSRARPPAGSGRRRGREALWAEGVCT